jgi:hypothetical protein
MQHKVLLHPGQHQHTQQTWHHQHHLPVAQQQVALLQLLLPLLTQVQELCPQLMVLLTQQIEMHTATARPQHTGRTHLQEN